jgi:hypothetical protein
MRTAAEQIRARLDYVAEYTDDDHWCARMAKELGFETVRLQAVNHPDYPLQLEVEGSPDLLSDPRLVVLVREAMAYQKAPGFRLSTGDDLLTLSIGDPVYARVAGLVYASIESARPETVGALESRGHGFGAMLRREVDVA